LDAIRVVIGDVGIRLLHGKNVNAAVYNAQRIKMNIVSVSSSGGAIGDLFILRLEEGRRRWTITSTVGFGPDGYLIVIGLVVGKLLEKHLSEMPYGDGSVSRGVRGDVEIIGRECADEESVVLFRNRPVW
jgi:hypothetical protein